MTKALRVLILIIFICGGNIKQCTSISSLKMSNITRSNTGITIWTTSLYNIFACAGVCSQITKCQSVALNTNENQCYFYSNIAKSHPDLEAIDYFVEANALSDVSL